MSFVEAKDGTRIYYKAWGAGTPVVLVHGWPLSSDSWDAIAYRLASAGYQTIAYDRRGFGRSDQPWSGYDYETLTSDLGVVVESLKLSTPHLVGFSMGGGEVVRYAASHPVKSITLIGSVVPGLLQSPTNPEGVPGEVFQGLQKDILLNRAEFFANFFPNFYGNGMLSKAVPDSTLEWTRNLAMQAGLKGTLDCIDSFGRTDFRANLPKIDVPALVIHGVEDQIVPIGITSKVAAQLLPCSELVEIQGGHHGILATHEDLIVERLLVHLGKVG